MTENVVITTNVAVKLSMEQRRRLHEKLTGKKGLATRAMISSWVLSTVDKKLANGDQLKEAEQKAVATCPNCRNLPKIRPVLKHVDTYIVEHLPILRAYHKPDAAKHIAFGENLRNDVRALLKASEN